MTIIILLICVLYNVLVLVACVMSGVKGTTRIWATLGLIASAIALAHQTT